MQKGIVLDIVESELLKAKTRKEFTGVPRFKPSSLGTPCLRKLYYDYHRISKDFDETPKLFRYAHIGDSIGDRISEMLRRGGVLVDYYNEDGSENIRFGEVNKEFPVKDSVLEISAMLDGVIIRDNKLWLGEWKSAGLKAFSGFLRPKPEHLVQGVTYLYIFNKALQSGVFKHIKELTNFQQAEGITFLYECRDDGLHKEFVITGASELFGKIVQKILAVREYTVKGICPPKAQDWCRSCPWRLKCAKDKIV